MFKFIIKFIASLIKVQKVRMLIVLCGMTICSLFVLSFFYFSSAGAYSKEELYEKYFNVIMRYENVEDIEELTNFLENKTGITKIELLAWFDEHEGTIAASDIPEELELQYSGEELILAAYVPAFEYDNNQIDLGRGFTAQETDKIMVTYAGASGHHISGEPGTIAELCGRKYEVCGYYNYYGYDFIIPVSEFISICNEYGAQVQLKFWYNTSINYEEVVGIAKEMEYTKKADKVICEKPDISISWDAIWNQGKIMIFAMIISILNFMFVYQFILKNRLQQYRVLKLLGITAKKLQVIMFAEIGITYSVSFVVAYGMLRMYIWYRDLLVYNMADVWMYAYFSLLTLVSIIFFLFTRKFSKSSPFASYQEI